MWELQCGSQASPLGWAGLGAPPLPPARQALKWTVLTSRSVVHGAHSPWSGGNGLESSNIDERRCCWARRGRGNAVHPPPPWGRDWSLKQPIDHWKASCISLQPGGAAAALAFGSVEPSECTSCVLPGAGSGSTHSLCARVTGVEVGCGEQGASGSPGGLGASWLLGCALRNPSRVPAPSSHVMEPCRHLPGSAGGCLSGCQARLWASDTPVPDTGSCWVRPGWFLDTALGEGPAAAVTHWGSV